MKLALLCLGFEKVSAHAAFVMFCQLTEGTYLHYSGLLKELERPKGSVAPEVRRFDFMCSTVANSLMPSGYITNDVPIYQILPKFISEKYVESEANNELLLQDICRSSYSTYLLVAKNVVKYHLHIVDVTEEMVESTMKAGGDLSDDTPAVQINAIPEEDLAKLQNSSDAFLIKADDLDFLNAPIGSVKVQ